MNRVLLGHVMPVKKRHPYREGTTVISSVTLSRTYYCVKLIPTDLVAGKSW